jgi:hypothetical protein
MVRVLSPSVAPDIGRLIREGTPYIKSDYLLVGVWSTSLLGLATAFAVLAATPPRWLLNPLRQLIDVTIYGTSVAKATRRWADGQGRPAIRYESGWSIAFQQYPDSFVWLTCELTDGRVIGGWLLSASPQVEETNDRSIVLSGPLRVRGSGADDQDFHDMAVGTLVIPAGQLRYVASSYFDTDQPTPF